MVPINNSSFHQHHSASGGAQAHRTTSAADHSASTMSSANDDGCCTDDQCCSTFYTVVTYPFYITWWVITWPFVQIYNLFSGNTSGNTGNTGNAGDAGTDPSIRGPDMNNPVFSQDIQDAARDYHINPGRLRDVPPAIDWAAIAANPAIQAIYPNAILDVFDAFYGQNWEGARQGITAAKRTEMREHLTEFLEFLRDRDTTLEGTSAAYYNELALMLKCNIVELRKPSLEPEKKKVFFQDFDDAITLCFPRRHEESLRLYKYLVNQEPTLEGCFLKWIQECKEGLIYEAFNGVARDQFHIVNHARLLVGERWGLDRTNADLANDPFIRTYAREPDPTRRGQTREIPAERYDQVLTARFTPEAAVHFIHYKQKEDGKAALVANFMGELAGAGELKFHGQTEDEFDYDEVFEGDGRTPSPKGIAFLLEKLNFLQHQ